jgi:hypothetical protein
MQSLIFDRVDIVAEIRETCLVSGGANIVVRSSQKVGKSHLLDHLYQFERVPDALFCRIDLDVLRAWAQGKPTDATFFKVLVHRVDERIAVWLAQALNNEAEWRREYDNADQEISRLAERVAKFDDADAAEELKSRNQRRLFVGQQLQQIPRLKLLHEKSRRLREAAYISPPHLEDLFADLQIEPKKHIVLFIDDFQRLLSEPGLTNALFEFLRAANMDRKISTLASSQLHLMDSSLHAGTREREALFNHFNDVALEPFDDAYADQFLDWLAPATPLTAEERSYLRTLGGRSPFFLKTVHQQFIRGRRPTQPDARDEFERVRLRETIDPAFREIWRRFTVPQRKLLRDVVERKRVNTTSDDALMLKREGYLVVSGGKADVFSSLFASFIAERADDAVPADIEVGVDLPARVPSALAFAQMGTPMIRFSLTCPPGQTAKVELSCTLHGYAAAPVRKLVTLKAGSVDETLSVLLSREKFKGLADMTVVQVDYDARLVDNGGRRLIGDAARVQVLANDVFVLARRDLSTRKLVDYSWMIAAWVNRDEKALVPIAQRARQLVPGSPDELPTDPAVMRARVASVYQALAEQNLQYDNSTLVFHQDDNDFAQRVRPPRRVIEEKAGNCLEACVLFASLMSAFEIEPIILFMRGHALVGWAGDDGLQFLETTTLGQKTFDEALQSGADKYGTVRALSEAWERGRPETIDDPGHFAIPVHVHEVIKAKQIQTLAI